MIRVRLFSCSHFRAHQQIGNCSYFRTCC
uniref:Uncharacterized protein n=1 Tax=Arundo donax TaxID=35708 RepID=A0A0A9BJF8_ARUDO